MKETEVYNKGGVVVDFSIQDGVTNDAVLSETALVLPEGYSQEQWSDLGHKLGSVSKSHMWWVGDWVLFGYRKDYSRTWDEFQRITGLAQSTLRFARQVSDRFESASRLALLEWSHHQEVVSLPLEEAKRILQEAAEQRLSTRDVRALASQSKALTRLPEASSPSGDTCSIKDLHEAVKDGRKFGCIYADPPWRYENQGTRAAMGGHYNGMSIDEICELPVIDLAADASHLHMWTTNAFLFECPKILEAWGFQLKSTFIWAKPEMGIGNYWRNSHEIMLTAVRGNATRFNDHSIKSWIECSRGDHSEKPFIVRDFLRRASPAPYLELFARTRSDGWTPWGNQIERCLFTHSVEKQFAEDAVEVVDGLPAKEWGMLV